MNDLATRLVELSPERLTLLKRRLSQTSETPRPARIPRLSRDTNSFPLSFSQERMWFDHQWEPESPLHNQAVVLSIKGMLDPDLLAQSVNEIVRRHEILRATFAEVEGQLVQTISPPQDAKISIIDLESCPQSERQVAALRLSKAEAMRPFQLDSGPLFRVSLLRLSNEDHVLVFIVHHIIFDGWSGGVHFGELFAIYDAWAHGRPSPLRPLPIQYVDYAAWQREQLRGGILAEQLEYWQRSLAGMPAALELPTDRPRPAVRNSAGGRVAFTISETLTSKLRQLSREQGATLFMILLAAFKVLLYRYSRQHDIVVGTPVSNREHSELEPLIGLFINTLVLRTELSGDMSFLELLGAVRETATAAYARRDYPFEKLLEILLPERDLSRTPLFQVFFDLQKIPALPAEPKGLSIELLKIDTATEQFDLSLSITESSSELSAQFGYSAQLFDAETIERMAIHFRLLLEGIVSDPAKRISELPLLTATERCQLLIEWNQTEAPISRDKCVQDLFEEQAQRNPEARAVSFAGATLTYGELNRRANKLARHLRTFGVGPETMVGICLERSLEWVVGLLGILKAGGAHASLDPTYPPERLAYMIEDAQTPVLLTTAALARNQKLNSSQVICLDSDWPTIELQSDANLDRLATADHPAYVVYTSGSTGKPKGVVTTHGALLNLVWWHRTTFNISPECRASQVARMGFDASVWELWPYLTAGASVNILDEETRYSPAGIVAWLIRNSITMGWLPPSLAELIFQEPEIAAVPLKVLFGGSDRAVLRPPPAAPFIYYNPYGPTESSVIVTNGVLAPQSEASGPIHVGRPLANTQIYILDECLQPVPVGVGGEIYIGGASLARGYLRDAGLTAEKFIPNPYGQAGERIYRTGDLGRYLADGNIEVLGRLDHQVKIRGFRIELGEVEQALVSHPAVREAIVLTKQETAGDKSLIAYFVPDGNRPQAQTQRTQLQASRVAQWRLLYEETYGQSTAVASPEFNVTGWNSSYTGLPIPADEMREWRDATVERIRTLDPRRVLEIGCGTGLLLFPIAPQTEKYWATDFSRASLDLLRRGIESAGDRLAHVRLFEQTADDFQNIDAGSFNLVILNSVIQYFPDAEYLLRVIEGAIKTVEPGGHVFLGDVRNLRLLEALHTSVQRSQAATDLSCAELARRVQRSVDQEEELLIDSRFFQALKDRIPAISQLQINLKRGRSHNEITGFRYDVILKVCGDSRRKANGQPPPAAECLQLDWTARSLTLNDLARLLRTEQPPALYVKNVPDARVMTDVRAAGLLRNETTATVGEVFANLSEIAEPGIDPEDAWTVCRDEGYAADLRLSPTSEPGYFDIFLTRDSSCASALVNHEALVPEPLSLYTNNPLRKAMTDQLLPQLRDYLSEKLPDYMLPAAFVELDSMPLMPNGKIDRRALPNLDRSDRTEAASFLPARTEMEKTLAQVWGEMLALERVSIEDNFFELGGHSLMVAQMVSRLRDILSLELPLRTIFEKPTVAELAEHIETIKWGTQTYSRADGIAAADTEEGEV